MVQPSITFDEDEFSASDFDPALFVLKYKDLTTLQDLREALRFYADQLKRQLYDLINQDYKDFITISTQLDGVDDRVEHLRRPLADLRLELYTIQDNLTSSIRAIDVKLEEKRQLSRKREMIESSLRCMDNLQVAEELLGLSSGHTIEGGKRRRSRKDVLKSASRKHVPFGLSVDVLECSTLEQAAHAVRAAKDNAGVQRGAPADSGVQMSSKAVGLRKMLEARAQTVRDALVNRIYERLTQMVTMSGTESANERSLAYCLRALAILNDGTVAENWMAETLMAPFLQSHITQGRIDGQRRGSFGGLKDVIADVMQHVHSVCLPTIHTAEQLFGTNRVPPIDFVVRGVWTPIYDAIMRVIGVKMFTVGIASTMHNNFIHCTQLLRSLENLLGEEHRSAVSMRLQQDPRWRDFNNKWNLPLYYQLRTTEIGARVEAAFNCVTTHGVSSNCIREVYEVSASGVGATAGGPSLSLPLETLQQLRSDAMVPSYLLPISTVVSTEVATCWHENVFLPQLAARFTKLTLQLFRRYEVWILESLNKDKQASNDTIEAELAAATAAPPSSSGKSKAIPGAVLLTAPVSELVLLVKDLLTMRNWLSSHVAAMICARAGVAGDATKPVQAALSIADERLREASDHVWAQIASCLAVECSSCLTSVQNIAVNYRMTRKPAPTTPSSFVENITAPVRRFLETHSAGEYPPFLPTIIDSICTQYLASVASLLETVRRMDTVIQRRVRGKKAEDNTADTVTGASKRAATSDSDKIMLQLFLDVLRFGDDVRLLGVDPMEFEGFRALKGEVSVAEDFIQ